MNDPDRHGGVRLTRRRLIEFGAGAAALAAAGAPAADAARRQASKTLTIATPTIPATLDYEAIRGFEDTQAVVNQYDQIAVLGPPKKGPGGAL